jgi:hypothetical protein
LCSFDVVVEAFEFGAVVGGVVAGGVLVVVDGGSDEGGVVVEGCEGVEDGVFKGVGGDAVGVAPVGAVALAVVAGVVAVGAGAAVGDVADVGGATLVAGDPSGEVVVGGVRGAFAVVFAAFDEDVLSGVEGVAVDEGGVGGGVPVQGSFMCAI